ncbi:MAG: 3'(2'),5'-bisphosphate nucleotidase CysQ [Planctomycetes bacterium]|nr:3'(2'),5'-bisphosphate nucleotidase CysQ [Planctomycetota bacterium]
MPTPDDLSQRLAFASSIARAAGARLLALRESGRWEDPKILGNIGDQAADGYLQGAIFGRYPDDAILSEETKDDLGRTGNSVAWIVDPLDGTKEYSSGRHDWAVHVGLAVDQSPVLGVVALPSINRVLTASVVDGCGDATVHGDTGEWPSQLVDIDQASEAKPLRLVASRSHTPEWMQRFAAQLGDAELVPCGSVGFKVSMLLFGKADIYVHKVGLKEWDTCAPEAIARAAGYEVCRFDGALHRYNQENARNDELVVCRPHLKERVLETLRLVGA